MPHRLGELLAERGIDFFEHPARRREGFGQAPAHADRLTALAGKNKRGRHALPLKERRKIPRSRRCQGSRPVTKRKPAVAKLGREPPGIVKMLVASSLR